MNIIPDNKCHLTVYVIYVVQPLDRSKIWKIYTILAGQMNFLLISQASISGCQLTEPEPCHLQDRTPLQSSSFQAEPS